METIGLWIIAGVVSLSLAIPVGLVLYLAYQTWRGDLRETYATESHRSSSLGRRRPCLRFLHIYQRQGEAWRGNSAGEIRNGRTSRQ